ncbi:response regulator [Sphingomonas sp. RT2P30]|uniref:response regulator n=1 Tax=Parasphingomonas halimpatiens TaxID=3096162 RepID=UPI002FC738B3
MWARAASFKAETVIFLSLVLTFATVLGQDSITREKMSLTPNSSGASPYSFDDRPNGGHSVLKFDSTKPLSWTCDLRPGFAFPFCGYGVVFNAATPRQGVDLSYVETIKVRLNYRGPPGKLRLALKNFDPAFSRVGADETLKPNTATFDIVEGDNLIELTPARFEIEAWWAANQKLTPEQAKPDFHNVIAIEFISGSGSPSGKFAVKVEEIEFEGVHLSPEQFYLIIIGAWLVLSALFLVFRFFDVKRSFEARQRELAEDGRALAEARAVAETASAAKSQFLANMSHELRTPLNAIIGYAQLLERDSLSERQRSAVGTIRHSGAHLLALITDILDISRVEAGKLELLPAPFDLRACIAGVTAMTRLRAEEKGLEFTAETAADVPDRVLADGKRLGQVLLNLLGNAVKFTTKGEVRLEVSTISWGDGDVRLRFDVLDTGDGIAPGQLERIFRPFEQAGSAIDRSCGTGLGLSISRQIVEMIGGEIGVESAPGRGSRFRVELPFALQSHHGVICAPALRGPGEAREILVVDDLETNRSLLQQALEAQGFRVREAKDGLEALEMIERARPDLIVMDVKMPVMDGLEALRRLRLRPGLRQLPVIAVSANPSAELEAAARRAGADRLLPKPIDLSRLDEVIAQLLAANPATDGGDCGETKPLVGPGCSQLQVLLDHARAGNMRAIRAMAGDIAEMSDEYRPFAERLQTLAAAYQSPAVLRLIEQQLKNKEAA